MDSEPQAKDSVAAAQVETAYTGDAQPHTAQGDTAVVATSVVASECLPRPREPNPDYSVRFRLEKEGRWREVSPIRDRMMTEARTKGMSKLEAQEWTYAELDRLYPPLPPKAAAQADQPASEPEVQGVYVVPDAWPPLPNNASLQSELGWVQAERLRVVEERAGKTTVRLERASTPAPSMAALAWLEASVRNYAKYLDILARAMSGQQDEQDATRREHASMQDIMTALDEMRPNDRCPTCGQVIDAGK